MSTVTRVCHDQPVGVPINQHQVRHSLMAEEVGADRLEGVLRVGRYGGWHDRLGRRVAVAYGADISIHSNPNDDDGFATALCAAIYHLGGPPDHRGQHQPTEPIRCQLWQTCLNALHAAHQATSGMTAQAQTTLFWPGISRDIAETRSKCQLCW